MAGQRRLQQFSTLEKAEEWAKEQHDGIEADGRKHFLLSHKHREAAIAAISLLEGAGLTLSQAAALAKKHHHTGVGSVTVRDAVDRLLAVKEAEDLRERSVRDLRNRLNVFCQTFGTRPVREITRSDVEAWLEDLCGVSDKSAEGFSARSKKNDLITVRTFFNYSIGRGFRAAENSAAKIASPKTDWDVPSILTPEEATTLLTTAQTQGELLQAIIACWSRGSVCLYDNSLPAMP